MNSEQSLGLTFREADLIAVHPNGNELAILGSNREDLIDTLRGFAMPLAIIDEAAFIRRGLLQRVVEDVLAIRLLDLDGELWMLSTPGLVPAGYFHDCYTGEVPGYTPFHWTFFDNPHLPLARPDLSPAQKRAWRFAWAESFKRRRGWTDKSPSYQREFLGLSARDEEALVYQYDPAVHLIDCMPASYRDNPRDWHKVLAIDYGHGNATSWALWAYEKGRPTAYCVKVAKISGKAPSEVAETTRQWIETYRPDVVVGDSGGLGKGYIAEAQVRFQLPIENADKVNKRAFIEFMNDAFRARPQPRILIVGPDCTDLTDEYLTLDWDPRYDRTDPRWHTAENPNAANDSADSGLYGWRACYAYIEGLLAEMAKAEEAKRVEGRRRDLDPDPDDRLQSPQEDPYAYARY